MGNSMLEPFGELGLYTAKLAENSLESGLSREYLK